MFRPWLAAFALVAATGCGRQAAGPPPLLQSEPPGAPVAGGDGWRPSDAGPGVDPLGGRRNFRSVAASPDGRWLACGEEAGSDGAVVRLFDRATGEQRAVLSGHKETPTHLAFAPDSSRLYTAPLPPDWGSHFGHLSVWDLSAGVETARLPCHTFALTPDRRTLATVENVTISSERRGGWWGPQVVEAVHRYRRVVRVRDTASWRETAGYAVADFPSAVALSPDGRHLAVGVREGVVRTWDRVAAAEGVRLDMTLSPKVVDLAFVNRLAFDSAGRRVLAVAGGWAAAWDWPAGTLAWKQRFASRPDEPFEARFSPDGRHILAYDGYRAAVWDAASGVELSRVVWSKGGWAIHGADFDPIPGRLHVADGTPRLRLLELPWLAPLPVAGPP